MQLWIDDNPIGEIDQSIELAAGRRSITFAIDRKTRGETIGLQVEIATPKNSTLKFKPEGGM